MHTSIFGTARRVTLEYSRQPVCSAGVSKAGSYLHLKRDDLIKKISICFGIQMYVGRTRLENQLGQVTETCWRKQCKDTIQEVFSKLRCPWENLLCQENAHTLFIPCYAQILTDPYFTQSGSIINNYCAASHLYHTILSVISCEEGEW